MTHESHIPPIEARAVTEPGGNEVPSALWVAGVRYPGGTEIWCAYRGGEDAWTTDRKLAATYQSESSATLAARLLADGVAEPFWTVCE